MPRPSLSTAGLVPLDRADLEQLLEELASVPDPRHASKIQFPLADMLFIALCSLLGGRLAFTDMSRFAEFKHAFLSELLGHEAPRPSHDAFRHLFMMMDGEFFCRYVDSWSERVAQRASQNDEAAQDSTRHIAMDGKSKARGQGSGGGRPPLHRVSAFLSQRGLTLTDRPTADKGGEVQALREIIEAIDLKDAVVTIDAGGTYIDIASALQAKGAHYVLALKGNQPKLNAQIEFFFQEFDEQCQRGVQTLPCFSQANSGHGRKEQRELQVCENIKWLEGSDNWPGLRSVIRVRRERKVGKTSPATSETSYYLSSWEAPPQQHAEVIRDHWAIENKLHWILDAHWREDRHPLRQTNALRNLATATRLALNLLRAHPRKDALKGKMLGCSLSDDFLAQCLGFSHA